jgi:hypothetical protein
MTIPLEYVIGLITLLGTTVSGLAGILWASMKSLLAKQEIRIGKQDSIIEKLQEDIERLSRGCGIANCIWKSRQ